MRLPYELTLTAPDQFDLAKFAQLLVQDRLCAAAHLDRMSTTYRWNDRIDHDIEQRAVLHTCRDRIEAINERIALEHPYEVFCLAGHPLSDGSYDYLQWIQDATA